MLFPKKVKHRKWQVGRRHVNRRGIASRGTTLAFGSHGLKADGAARITANQIESGRKVISRGIKKVGKMWTRVFPDRPLTKKAAEVGMGKGKGDPYGFCFEVQPGRIIYEIDGLSQTESALLLRKAGAKFPMKTRVVNRNEA
ncbi:MAG: 50S ribosomal protein L16 [Candidatus Vogelbacteria bacterium]|nr:50S ribosomal protein L16 [Candidatus Vogelbacteria bacterium]